MNKNQKPLLIAGAFSSISAFFEMAASNPLRLTVEAKEDKALIHIEGVIYEFQNSAASFKRKLTDLRNRGVKNAHVTMNTPGGDVFEANEIVNEVEKFEGSISGDGGALVASAGTYIAMNLESFTMAENGQWMYHKPMGVVRGNEDKVEADLKLLKNLTNLYRDKYAEKTGMSAETIEANWAKGDVWLDAKEALKQKFISGITPKIKLSASAVSMLAACGSPNPGQVEDFTPPKEKPKTDNKKIEMELKVLAAQLGLDPETATQADVNAKIEALKKAETDAATFKAQQERDTKEDREKEIQKIKAQAIKDKKITTAQADSLDAFATSNFEGWKAHLEVLKPLEKPTTTSGGGDGSKKKFMDYTEAERVEMQEENPEKFEALYDAYLDEQ